MNYLFILLITLNLPEQVPLPDEEVSEQSCVVQLILQKYLSPALRVLFIPEAGQSTITRLHVQVLTFAIPREYVFPALLQISQQRSCSFLDMFSTDALDDSVTL